MRLWSRFLLVLLHDVTGVTSQPVLARDAQVNTAMEFSLLVFLTDYILISKPPELQLLLQMSRHSSHGQNGQSLQSVPWVGCSAHGNSQAQL